MPEMKMIEVTTSDLRRGDIVWKCEANRRAEGDRVRAITFGRTRYTVAFEEGPDRAFYAADEFTVERSVLTAEEEADIERRYVVGSLRRLIESANTDRHEEILRAALASERETYLDWSLMSELIEKQTLARHGAWLAAEVETFLTVTDDELLALMGAFGSVVALRENRHPRSPISRSTNQVSNLMEDVEKYVQDNLIQDALGRGRFTPADLLAAYRECCEKVAAARSAA